MRNLVLSIAAVSLYICAVEAKAGVVNNADVVISGTIYRTFVDQSTGRTWLDIDNFCDAANTYNSIAATLVGSGFHLATTAELQELQLSIPAVPANFLSESTIVGGNYAGNPRSVADRGIMWGIFDDGDISNNVSWAYRVDFVEPWHNQFNFLLATDVLSSKSSQQDLGAWVVADTAATTPLPGALPLFASGLGACGLLAWRRKRSRLATTAITT